MTQICDLDESCRCWRCDRVASSPLAVRQCEPSPSPLARAANFAVAAAGHIAAGAPMASEEEIASRYAICSQCEFLVNDSCAKCGCGISRIRGYVSKLSWADQECPVGKWGKAMPPKEGPPPTS